MVLFLLYSAELHPLGPEFKMYVVRLMQTRKLMGFQRHRHSLEAVVPLHTQRFAAIGRLQQLELKQDRLVQVSAHKRLIVEDGDADNWGVHYWMSGKPDGEKQQIYSTFIREKVERDV